jgi:hypothetical protein
VCSCARRSWFRRTTRNNCCRAGSTRSRAAGLRVDEVEVIVVANRCTDATAEIAFGDWHMVKMAAQLRGIRAAYRGTDPAWADEYFFDFNDASR